MPKVTQKPFNFKLEITKKNATVTSFSGLPLLRETMKRLGIIDAMKKFCLKRIGYSDEIIIEALIMLIASGGRSVSDWEYMKQESGFQKIYGYCPSVDTLERYLRKFQLETPERDSGCGQVGCSGELEQLHSILILEAYKIAGSPDKLTLDIDATIIDTNKDEALYCYQMHKAYQPMNVYCPELQMILAHEFRDGNVSPAEGYQRLVERCKRLLPDAHFTVRADAAAYQNNFLEWMTENKMRYYITAKRSGSTLDWLCSQPSWRPLILNNINTGQEVAEIGYPISFANKKQLKLRSRTRKYVATRRERDQSDLFDKYVYQVIVTNALWESEEENIQMHRKRCGTVEYAQGQLKSQCGADRMPSGDFSVNAAWYSIGVFTHNLIRFIQSHLLPESWKRLEIQTVRFRLIRSAAVVIKKVRTIILRFCKDHPLYDIYKKARLKLAALPI